VNVQTFFLALLAVAAGALFPVQSAANSLLGKSVGGPVAATLISFTVGWFMLLAADAVGFRQFFSLADIAATPIWLLLVGGVLGATFLGVNVMLAPRLGSAALLCLVIAGQLLAAVTIDRLGLFSFAIREFSIGRVVGVALVFAGAVLVALT
jgi:bacterial/archaeal transporter family-2 protein